MDENKVYQRYSNDCAIACLAMLLDLKYSPVRAAVMDYFNNTLKKEFCGMTDDDDIAVAKRFGAVIKSKRVTRRNRRACIDRLTGVRAILEVPALDGSGDLHAVFWTGYKLVDPAGKDSKQYPSCGTLALWRMTRYEVMEDEEKEDSINPI